MLPNHAQKSADAPPQGQGAALSLRRYGAVVVCVALALGLRLLLQPVLRDRAAFITLFPAVIVSAWIAGWCGGLLATLLTGVAAAVFLLPPTQSIVVESRADQAALLLYLLVGLGISALGQAQRAARQRAEAAAAVFREGETRKSAVLETALDCIITIDAQGRIVEFNPAAERTFDYARSEVLGRTIAETIIPPSLREAHYQGFAHYLATGEGPILRRRVEVVGMRRGGAEFPLEIAIAPTSEGGRAEFTAYLRDITERRRFEAQIQARAEREAVLNKIGQAIRVSEEPEAIQAAAVRALGEALGADRALFVLLHPADDTIVFGQDWHRPDLPSLAGEHRISQLPPELVRVFRTAGTLAVEDTARWPWDAQTGAILGGMGLRALVHVPLLDADEVVGVLGVAMVDGPRAWTGDEVSLVEAAAVQTRAAVETARTVRRERNIATQLQQALQPALPDAMPGLAVKGYYKAALEEAGVGGDFCDVFAVNDRCTALVVGDLAGKGLAAAAQVATVRNMARYALYRSRTLAGAITNLNAVLVEQELLSGFSTLFVGAYDADARTLTYVNCGQEPALVRRAETKTIDMLPPTGPVLGGFNGGEFSEAVIGLSPGDALAVFTDGLTEAGPTRATLLGADGVACLLAGLPPATGGQTPLEAASALTADLISAVAAYGQGGVRDDVCLLVGVAV